MLVYDNILSEVSFKDFWTLIAKLPRHKLLEAQDMDSSQWLDDGSLNFII